MKAQPRRPSRQPTLLRVWPRLALLLLCAGALGAPLTAGADPEAQTVVAPALLEAVQANPNSDFNVIVEGETSSDDVAQDIESLTPEDTAVSQSFETVPAVAATLTGNEILSLADGAASDPLVITRDAPVTTADEPAPARADAASTGRRHADGDRPRRARRDSHGDSAGRRRNADLRLPMGALQPRRLLGGGARRSPTRVLVSRRTAGKCRSPLPGPRLAAFRVLG